MNLYDRRKTCPKFLILHCGMHMSLLLVLVHRQNSFYHSLGSSSQYLSRRLRYSSHDAEKNNVIFEGNQVRIHGKVFPNTKAKKFHVNWH